MKLVVNILDNGLCSSKARIKFYRNKSVMSKNLSVFLKSDSGLFETVTYKPKGIFLKTVAALSVHLFLVDSVLFHLGEITLL